MITGINSIRNVTQFDSVQPGNDVDFRRLTLIYAENGRGKSSLAAIFRSLSSGDPLPIQERSRLGSSQSPHIVIQSNAPAGQFVFQNAAWNQSYPALSIFDDVFVTENVYSGLEVQPSHRQKFHECILGSRGVALAQRVDQLIAEIADLNSQIAQASAKFSADLRGNLTVDQFCDLVARPNVEEEIAEVQRQITALSHASKIATTAPFPQLSLSPIYVEPIQTILSSSLANVDQSALAKVAVHFPQIGAGGEQWIADGVDREIPPAGGTGSSTCPYCAQDLSGSAIVAHYRAYFGQGYTNLKRAITDSQQHLGSVLSNNSLSTFLQQIQDVQNKSRFWGQYCHIPEVDLDAQAARTLWEQTRDTLMRALDIKRASPLEPLHLAEGDLDVVSRYAQLVNHVSRLNRQLQLANTHIQLVKHNTSQGNLSDLNAHLNLLRTTQTRFLPDVALLCDTYAGLKRQKARVQDSKGKARKELDEYRAVVFPNFQYAINTHLQRFNTGFEVVNVQPFNTGGRLSSTYQIRINNVPVNLGGAEGEPSFKTVLSGGDRDSLALAFFLASLDQEPDLSEKIVVLDDVVVSLDEQRRFVTAEEIQRILQRVSQVVVLSHNKSFLVEIWNALHGTDVSTLQIVRAPEGSLLTTWDPATDAHTDHQPPVATLYNYQDNSQVAEGIRHLLENYLRAKFPTHFPPGSMLDPFVALARQHIGQPLELLNLARLEELSSIVEGASKFHRESDADGRTEGMTSRELLGLIQRTLNFIQV
jgi:wobble nucleotide-excising tRNase